jgi:hypothetical protein
MALGKTEQKRVKQLRRLMSEMFPDGNIPPFTEIQAALENGTMTIREGMIGRLYRRGLALDQFFDTQRSEIPEDLAKFADSLREAFPIRDRAAANLEGVVKNLGTVNNSPKFSLDSPFVELEEAAKAQDITSTIRKNIFSPITTDIPDIRNANIPAPKTAGSRKLVDKGDIPIEVLEEIMDGIGDIPDPVLRDAVVASMIGYRGTDLSNIRTTAEFAGGTNPPRPYYDPASGTMLTPDVSVGRGRKGITENKPLGPLMQSIMDRRHAGATAAGELFPDIETDDITKALKTYVYPKISPETIAQLNKAPSGYTDIRRIVAAAIANKLGDPTAAAEIIDHPQASLDEKIDKTMTGYYTNVVNPDAIEARRTALVGFEALMAQAALGDVPNADVRDARQLANYLNLEVPEDFNARYPELDILSRGEVPSAAPEPLSPEEIEANKQERLAKSGARTAAATADQAASTVAAQRDMATAAAGAEQFVEDARTTAAATAQANLAQEDATADAKKQKKQETRAERMARIRKSFKPLVTFVPFVGTAAAAAGIPQVREGISDTMQELFGMSPAMADTVGTVGAIADFGIGEIAQVAPSDVVAAGQALASMDATVDPKSLETADMAPRLVGREEFAGPRGPGFASIPRNDFSPIEIPAFPPTSSGMLEAANAKDRVNLATRAAEQGQATTMTGSFLNPEPR